MPLLVPVSRVAPPVVFLSSLFDWLIVALCFLALWSVMCRPLDIDRKPLNLNELGRIFGPCEHRAISCCYSIAGEPFVVGTTLLLVFIVSYGLW
jgi:hypothetical protein